MVFTSSIAQGIVPGSNTLLANSPNFNDALSSNCVIMGTQSCNQGSDLTNVTAIGSFCSTSAVTMTDCTFYGTDVLTNATGPLNAFTAVGSQAGLSATGTQNCTYVGYNSGSDDGGNSNTAIGAMALSGMGGGNGDNNVAIGYQAGNAWVGTGEANNIAISASGNAGDVGVINIGIQGTQTACTIAGIYGVTPGASPMANVVIDVNGQLGTGGTPSLTWTTITTDTTASSNMGYVVNSSGTPVTITLPVSPALYDEVAITGFIPTANAGWIVDPGAGVGTIYYGHTQADTISSTLRSDGIRLICSNISGGINYWSVLSSQGLLLVSGNAF